MFKGNKYKDVGSSHSSQAVLNPTKHIHSQKVLESAGKSCPKSSLQPDNQRYVFVTKTECPPTFGMMRLCTVIKSVWIYVTRNCRLQYSNELTPKILRQQLWFLHFAHHLMMLYICNICIKFHENISKSFQVKELTGNYLLDSKGCSSKNTLIGVTVLALCTMSDDTI